jgi:hypothetical protein
MRQTREAFGMNRDLSLFAEALVFVHGNKAGAEAARHAALCKKSGDEDTAEIWRNVQRTIGISKPKLAA